MTADVVLHNKSSKRSVNDLSQHSTSWTANNRNF